MDGFESQIEEEQKAKRSEIKSTEARRRRGDRSFWDRYPESILSRIGALINYPSTNPFSSFSGDHPPALLD